MDTVFITSSTSRLGSALRPGQAMQPRVVVLPPVPPPSQPTSTTSSSDRQQPLRHSWWCSHSSSSSTATVARASKAANSSFDAEEDLDSDLAEELSRFRSPDAWNKVAERLDIVWKIGRGRGKRAMCGCCEGTGEEECAWCHGTGAMMVGDTLFRSADGSSHCPVCKGKGYVPCENCRGTGYRASWMQGPDQCKNPV